MKQNTNSFLMIRNLIAEDDIKGAIEQFRLLLEDSPKLDEVILQSARFQAIRKQIRLGTTSRENANINKAQIRAGLLDLLDEIEIPEHQKAFENEHLIKVVIEAIAPHSKVAGRFFKKAANIPDWESQWQISDKAKEIIAYSFVGVIGIQLSKLMAIGKEEFSEEKQGKYIEKCLHIIKRILDLSNFSLLSSLWDATKQMSYDISLAQKEVILDRFDKVFEQSILEQFQLFQVLHEIHIKNELNFPLSELKEFTPNFAKNCEFYKLIQTLEKLNQNLGKTQFTIAQCFKIEKHLSSFLTYFAFLVKYQMASIKRIGYKEIRNNAPRYVHRYAALGIDSKTNVDSEKINYVSQPIQTDTVLLYQDNDYRKNISLFPFVIDYNTLTFEHGAKICFFHSINITDDSLQYLFLEDGSIINIEMNEIMNDKTNFGEIIMDEEKYKIWNLDNVVIGFRKAKKSILGEEFQSSDS